MHTHLRADPGVDEAVGVVAGVQGVRRAIDNRLEFVLQLETLREAELAPIDLAKKLDHHRNFHRTRRVKALVGAKVQRVPTGEVAKGDCHRRAGDFGNASLDMCPQRIIRRGRDARRRQRTRHLA